MSKDAKSLLAESFQNTGPIEKHLEAVATEREPRDAVAICTARIDEAAPELRAAIEKAASGEVLLETEKTFVFRGLYILGAGRDSQTFPLMLALLHRPCDEVEELLGDAITEGLARITAGVYNGDAEALFGAIADRSLHEFIREALFGAAAFLCWEGRIERTRMVSFIEQFYEQKPAADGGQAWIGWLEAVAHLGLRAQAPLVHAAWDEGRLPPGVLDRRHFEEDLSAAEQAPDDVDRFKRANLGYIDDVLEALEWTWRWQDDGGQEKHGLLWTDKPVLTNIPAQNLWRRVGRNDPCPCGSGKKAKKCCLAS